jgi:hypothetical protein
MKGVSLVAATLVLASCAGQPPRGSPGVVTPESWVETWEYAGQPGKLVRTPSYRLFTTAGDRELVARMPEFLEAALERYTTAFGPLPRPSLRLDTFLMGDRDQWETLTRQVMGADAPTYLRIERGGFASGGRALLWTIGPRDTLAIAAHEGWHQFTQRTFQQELPAWLEEGIAVWMEGFVPHPNDPARVVFNPWANPERFGQLVLAAGRNDLIPLAGLINDSPQELMARSTQGTLTYYAELWALVLFLREGEGGRYAAGLNRAVGDAAAGRLPKGALLEAYIEPDATALESAYFAFVNRMVSKIRPEAIESGFPPILSTDQSGIAPPDEPLIEEVRAGDGGTPRYASERSMTRRTTGPAVSEP